MKKINTLGIDLAKSSFAVCGLNEPGKQVIKKELRRENIASFIQNLEPCLIAMEACGSAHFWARKFSFFGHDVKLIAAQKVVGFRKCNKNDSNDAYAIAVASRCPGLEFVGIKSVAQQDIQSVLRLRAGLIKRQTALANEMRGLLGEYGVAMPEGLNVIRSKLAEISATDIGESLGLSNVIIECSKAANEELIELSRRIETFEKLLQNLTKEDERCRRLQTIPGVGPLTAATIVSSIVDVNSYRNGRQFAASIGLTPRHVQTGGKESKPIQLGITKHGDAILRSLLVQGGMTVAAHCKARRTLRASKRIPESPVNAFKVNENTPKKQVGEKVGTLFPVKERSKKKAAKKLLSEDRETWILRLIDEKGLQKTAVAIANRNARIIHSILKHGGTYSADQSQCTAAIVA